MATEQLQLQFAHLDGHTIVCYSFDESSYITCGADGDLRIWSGRTNEDPQSECIGETATALAAAKNYLYTTTDSFQIQIYTLPELKRDGVVTRFTAPITDIDITQKRIAAGSCDMTIRVTELNKQEASVVTLTGHLAPVTGVTLDPLDKYLVSSSCDGSVKIWQVSDGTLIKTVPDLIPRANDYFKVTCLGKCSWMPSGDYFGVPKQKEVLLFERDTWAIAGTLTCNTLYHNLSLVKFSRDGNLLAAGSVFGDLIIWHVPTKSVVLQKEHPRQAAICSLSWRHDNDSLAITDRLGHCGVIEDISSRLESILPVNPNQNDDDNDNEISLDDIKQLSDFRADSDNDDAVSSKKHYKVCHEHVELQHVFQPSSTPTHFQHRFMVWNSIGIIRSHNTEDELSIDVEFHDTSFHHGLHFNNHDEYTMAALSTKLIALACMGNEEDILSKLTCVLLNAWDGTKQWSIKMPEDENIIALAAAGDWVAVATDLNNLRVFTWTSVQRMPLALPGVPVAMSGRDQYVAVAYHQGPGFNESQNMGITVYEITKLTVRVAVGSLSLPLTPSSLLKWLGFTDESRLCAFDSFGTLRCLAIGQTHWNVLSELKPPAKTDHYFLISVSEKDQTAQSILCRGGYYPMTTPRPLPVDIPLRVPLCEPELERVPLEETYCRLLSTLQLLLQQSDSNTLEKTQKSLTQTLLKLFANACRSNSDSRAIDLASSMDSEQLNLAHKYASKSGKLQLAQKLMDIKPVDWSLELSQGNNLVKSDLDGDGIQNTEYSSQRDLFEVPTGFSGVSKENVNKILQAENESNTEETFSPLPIVCRNPFKTDKPKASSAPKGLKFFEQSLPTKEVITNPADKSNSSMKKTVNKPKVVRSKNPEPSTNKKPTFVEWFGTQKAKLAEEFPGVSAEDLTKIGMKRFRESASQVTAESAKRKFEEESESEPSVASKLSKFANVE